MTFLVHTLGARLPTFDSQLPHLVARDPGLISELIQASVSTSVSGDDGKILLYPMT